MWRALRIACAVLAVASFGVAVLAVVQSARAYDYAGRWFNRATYVAECLPQVQPPNLQEACQRLATEPSPPSQDGVVPTDKELLLAEGTTMHSTATALLTISGILLAACGLFFNGWNQLRQRSAGGTAGAEALAAAVPDALADTGLRCL